MSLRGAERRSKLKDKIASPSAHNDIKSGRGVLEGRSPSPLKERGIKGVR